MGQIPTGNCGYWGEKLWFTVGRNCGGLDVVAIQAGRDGCWLGRVPPNLATKWGRGTRLGSSEGWFPHGDYKYGGGGETAVIPPITNCINISFIRSDEYGRSLSSHHVSSICSVPAKKVATTGTETAVSPNSLSRPKSHKIKIVR